MASKRRLEGCLGNDARTVKQPHIQDSESDLERVVNDLAGVVFSQYELLRRIFTFLHPRDLFTASLGLFLHMLTP